jgi:hypothetical protein
MSLFWRINGINDSTPAECRGFSHSAFVVRFPVILRHLIVNEKGSFLTIAGSS